MTQELSKVLTWSFSISRYFGSFQAKESFCLIQVIKLVLYFCPIMSIRYQSLHTSVQSIFNVTIHLKIWVIVEMWIQKVSSTMQRPIKLDLPSCINDVQYRLVTSTYQKLKTIDQLIFIMRYKNYKDITLTHLTRDRNASLPPLDIVEITYYFLSCTIHCFIKKSHCRRFIRIYQSKHLYKGSCSPKTRSNIWPKATTIQDNCFKSSSLLCGYKFARLPFGG